ncbi:hypothetical protein UlMin_044946 [Ulmus minor]
MMNKRSCLKKRKQRIYNFCISRVFVVAWACDHFIADKKIIGGTTPSTVSNQEWWAETDKKFQAWPRTVGPLVVMNPLSRQNFIVKSRD